MTHLIAVLALVIAGRNPFQFVEPPAVKPKIVPKAAPPPAPVVVQPPVIVETKPAVPPLPEFPYHLIGIFGKRDDPIVALSGKGQVITAQRGDTIDDAFVVRSIGLESIEIGFVTRPETLRIQMDGWI